MKMKPANQTMFIRTVRKMKRSITNMPLKGDPITLFANYLLYLKLDAEYLVLYRK